MPYVHVIVHSTASPYNPIRKLCSPMEIMEMVRLLKVQNRKSDPSITYPRT